MVELFNEGKNAERAAGNPKMCNTCSKRTRCKVRMNLKKIYDDPKENVISVRIDLVNFEHNHEFLKKDRKKISYSATKCTILNIWSSLVRCRKAEFRNIVLWILFRKCMVV
jgi:hypothetical protein